MTDSERMKYAHVYVSKLANGINPLDDSVIEGNEVINNQHISRCLQYVSTVLEKVVNGDYFLKRSASISPYPDVTHLLDNFQFFRPGLTVGELCGRLNSVRNQGSMRLSGTAVKRWLKQSGLVEFADTAEGQRLVYPTLKGEKFGLRLEMMEGRYGKYSALMLNQHAQHEVVKNVPAIMREHWDNIESRNELRSRPWDFQQEDQIKSMYQQGMTVQQIAAAMGRTSGAIRARLVRLGALR